MNLPLERIAPADARELSELLARCDRDGQRVAIEGGNTLCGMGYPPQADLTLSTTGMAGIVEYEPADLTVAALAGTRIRSLQQTLAQRGQFVPFDAPLPHEATLGGTLAAGWLGPRRHLYGRPRDAIIGSTVVLADGTLAHAGGMVVKNVAGYDMSRLYVGSFGTLGVLVRANLKTMAMPAVTRAFLARLPEGTRARAFARLTALDARPAAAFWADGFHPAVDGDDGSEGRLVVVIEGSEALAERATRELRSALGKAGVPETRVVDAGAREALERAIDAYVATLGERSVTYRTPGFPGEAERRALAIAALAAQFELRHETLVDVMNGDVMTRVSDLDARSLGAKIEGFDDALHEMEPRASVIAGRHPHRANLSAWGAPPAAIERMRALKRRFDPNGTLNAGRFVGGI